jgi:hypothetical protein
MQNAHSYNGDLQCNLAREGLRYTVVDSTIELKLGVDSIHLAHGSGGLL